MATYRRLSLQPFGFSKEHSNIQYGRCGLADGSSKKGIGGEKKGKQKKKKRNRKHWGVRSHIFSFPGGTVVKNPAANAGDARDRALIPESGRFPGVGNGNLLQYFCLENSMDRGAWWAKVHIVHGVAKCRIQLGK